MRFTIVVVITWPHNSIFQWKLINLYPVVLSVNRELPFHQRHRLSKRTPKYLGKLMLLCLSNSTPSTKPMNNLQSVFPLLILNNQGLIFEIVFPKKRPIAPPRWLLCADSPRPPPPAPAAFSPTKLHFPAVCSSICANSSFSEHRVASWQS